VKITHVITRLIVGGAQENTLACVRGLSSRPGWDVRLISGPTSGAEGTLEPLAAELDDRFIRVPELVRPLHPLKDWMAWARLVRLFRAHGPDLVHTHSGKAGFLGRLAARRAGVRWIVHTIHGPSFGPFQGAASNSLYRAAERVAGRVTTHFVSVAQAMTDAYLAAGIGRPDQYTCIYSGFPLEPFLAAGAQGGDRARWGLRAGDIVIGKIARLFRLKGHDDLLAVAPALAERHPRARFLLVGDGPWRARLERDARRLGLAERFVFAGLVPPSEMPALLGAMDVVVHLSRREGLPRVLPQALAAGRPVVAYDCDGAREVCRDGETGFLVAPGDRARLLDRLEMLAEDAALRRRMGDQGRTWVQPRFSEEKMVLDLAALYERLAKAGPGSRAA